ncbi:hypothetical protein RUM43_004188 [Polyplax serrata]|uniref:Uncharacterized protein n=1 Tax=Polyplax serrata TaxID=468196 RepID=A0AAN8XMS6_POLSC
MRLIGRDKSTSITISVMWTSRYARVMGSGTPGANSLVHVRPEEDAAAQKGDEADTMMIYGQSDEVYEAAGGEEEEEQEEAQMGGENCKDVLAGTR